MSSSWNRMYGEVIQAFKRECKNLIEAFEDKHSVDFKDFIPLWKAFGFNLIYEKYSRKYKIQESLFKEDTLQIAKAIMLDDNFFAGIFLLYSLYYVQGEPKALIRIELEELNKLMGLLKEERKTLTPRESCQPGFLFAKLISCHAFDFVVISREYSMEGQFRARAIFGNHLTPKLEHKELLVNKLSNSDSGRSESAQRIIELDEVITRKKQELMSRFPELGLSFYKYPEDSGTLEEEAIGSKRKILKGRKRKGKQLNGTVLDSDVQAVQHKSCLKQGTEATLTTSSKNVEEDTKIKEDEQAPMSDNLKMLLSLPLIE